jgi:hypothetical protein
MEGLDVQHLDTLLFVVIGLIFVTLAALIAYVVVASWRRKAEMSRASRSDEAGPVLALVRESSWAPLEVEIGGKRYRSFAEIEDPQIKRQLVQSAAELLRFTGAVGADVAAPAPLDKTYSWREDLRESSKGELDRIGDPDTVEEMPRETAPQEVEQRFLSLLEDLGRSHAQPPKPTLASSYQHAMRPKLSELDRTPSFVDDIEDIIQRRIQLIPPLQGRGLHIQTGPGGLVRFAFEGQEYESLADLPNLTAQELIRDAIQEWEQTT